VCEEEDGLGEVIELVDAATWFGSAIINAFFNFMLYALFGRTDGWSFIKSGASDCTWKYL
jgi:hypothetical protein